MPDTAAVSQPKTKVKAKKSSLRGGGKSKGDKKADVRNNSAKKSKVSKLSTFSDTATMDTATTFNSNESVTVYQQQLVIKQLNEAVKRFDVENKKIWSRLQLHKVIQTNTKSHLMEINHQHRL